MSGRLVGEVSDWLETPAAVELDLKVADRLVLMLVAERCEEHSRKMLRHRLDEEPLIDRLARQTGLEKEAGLKRVFQRLAKAGLEVRVPIKYGKDGRPVFAFEGRSPSFALPSFPASISIPERRDHHPPSGVEVAAEGTERGHYSPASQGPTAVDNRPDHGLRVVDNRSDPDPEAVLSGPALDPEAVLSDPRGGTKRPQRRYRSTALSPSVPSVPSNDSPSSGVPSSLAEVEGSLPGSIKDWNSAEYVSALSVLSGLPDAGSALVAQAAADHPGEPREIHIIRAASIADRRSA